MSPTRKKRTGATQTFVSAYNNNRKKQAAKEVALLNFELDRLGKKRTKLDANINRAFKGNNGSLWKFHQETSKDRTNQKRCDKKMAITRKQIVNLKKIMSRSSDIRGGACGSCSGTKKGGGLKSKLTNLFKR